MQVWQVLPLVPPERGFWSPYSGLDAMCGNVLLIAIDELQQEGLIDAADLPQRQPVANADFAKVRGHQTLLQACLYFEGPIFYIVVPPAGLSVLSHIMGLGKAFFWASSRK